MIGNDNTVEFTAATVKAERAEVYPGATTHLLVHMEGRGLSLMINDIFSIVDTFLNCLIANVNGIVAFRRDVWLIACHRNILSFRSFHLSCRSFSEWILTILISTLMEGEPRRRSIDPPLRPIFHITAELIVIVHNDLMLLPVALTWREDHGTSVLKHRNKIRQHHRLGIEILSGTEEVRTLPLPPPLSVVIIASMTGPYRYMAVLKTIGDLQRTRHIPHPWLTIIADASPGIEFLFGTTGTLVGYILKPAPVGEDHQIILPVLRWQLFPHILIYVLYCFPIETDFRQGIVDLYVYRLHVLVQLARDQRWTCLKTELAVFYMCQSCLYL